MKSLLNERNQHFSVFWYLIACSMKDFQGDRNLIHKWLYFIFKLIDMRYNIPGVWYFSFNSVREKKKLFRILIPYNSHHYQHIIFSILNQLLYFNYKIRQSKFKYLFLYNSHVLYIKQM